MTMQIPEPSPQIELSQRFTDYLPTLFGGVVVLALGVAAGWVAKRAVIRILIWLRLDRLGGRYGWRAAFGKGDVRAALYEVLGTIVMVLVSLAFLEETLQIWGLTGLAAVVDRFILYVPNLALVGLIVGAGWWLATTLARRVEDALEEEQVDKAPLLAKALKGALLAVVGALALWQLNLAREIVLAAFLIAFGAMGVAFAMAVGLGSAKAVQRGLESLFRTQEKER